MEIKKLEDMVSGSGIFILYGPSKAGKTFSITTLPLERTLIVQVEKGLMTLKTLCPSISVAAVNVTNDVREIHRYLVENPSSFDFIVMDSLTEFAILALGEAKKECADGRVYYTNMADTVAGMIKAFAELPQTVIFIAEEERVNQEDAGVLDYVFAPSIPGRKFAQKVPYKFDFIFCLRTKVLEDGTLDRRFQTAPNGDYLCGSRSSALEKFEPADWTNIFKKLNEEV